MMSCIAGECKTSTTGIFIVTPSLEGWPTKDKVATSVDDVRLALLDTNNASSLHRAAWPQKYGKM